MIGENFVHPGNNSFGGFAEERIARDLIAVEEIFQQLGIVIRHFLEVRDAPALVNRIAVEAAADLIVDAAESHAFEGAFGNVEQVRIARGLIALEKQVDSACVREFRGLAKAAVLLVEEMQRGFDD